MSTSGKMTWSTRLRSWLWLLATLVSLPSQTSRCRCRHKNCGSLMNSSFLANVDRDEHDSQLKSSMVSVLMNWAIQSSRVMPSGLLPGGGRLSVMTLNTSRLSGYLYLQLWQARWLPIRPRLGKLRNRWLNRSKATRLIDCFVQSSVSAFITTF